AVVFFTVPMSHLRGIPTALRERFGVPVVYYDADVPMSLPEYGGMDTGFNIYHGADPSEYDLVLSNSEGGLDRLRELGAKRAEAYASSTTRLFELAAAGAAIVTNPYEGIERWFEPGRELVVVRDSDEAEQVYRELLADPAAREELGRRARERALEEHTYVARARRLLELIGLRVPEAVELARG